MAIRRETNGRASVELPVAKFLAGWVAEEDVAAVVGHDQLASVGWAPGASAMARAFGTLQPRITTGCRYSGVVKATARHPKRLLDVALCVLHWLYCEHAR